MFFGQKSFVLGLQVSPPRNRIVEFFTARRQHIDRFGVGHVRERFFDHRLELFDFSFFDPLVKELHVLLTEVQTIAEDPFQKIFGQLHVVAKIKEGRFGFDHPKFGQMSTGVAVFARKVGPNVYTRPNAVA